MAAFACGAGANTLTGNAEEVVIDSYYDHIVLTNLVASGVGNAPTGNTHPSFDGQGILIASFDGALIAPWVRLGGESFMNDTHANNFTGIDAIATWNAPGAGLFLFPVVGFNEQNGFYEGSTVLSGVLSWNVPAGESMIFPGSAILLPRSPNRRRGLSCYSASRDLCSRNIAAVEVISRALPEARANGQFNLCLLIGGAARSEKSEAYLRERGARACRLQRFFPAEAGKRAPRGIRGGSGSPQRPCLCVAFRGSKESMGGCPLWRKSAPTNAKLA